MHLDAGPYLPRFRFLPFQPSSALLPFPSTLFSPSCSPQPSVSPTPFAFALSLSPYRAPIPLLTLTHRSLTKIVHFSDGDGSECPTEVRFRGFLFTFSPAPRRLLRMGVHLPVPLHNAN
jgi:hypothetical protein